MRQRAAFPAGRGGAGEGAPSPILRGLRIQSGVVAALAMRELRTRFGGSRIGVVWLFIEPLVLASAIASFKWAVGGIRVPGVSIFVFALVSYLPFFMFRAIVGRSAGTISANIALFYHSRVKLLDVVMARHVLEAAAVSAVMFLIVICVMMWSTAPANIPMLVIGLALTFFLSNGLGLLAAAATARWKTTAYVIAPAVYCSLPISGTLIPFFGSDPGMQAVLAWNPLAHVHEMVRDGFFGDRLPSFYSFGYVLFFSAVMNLLGLAALRVVRPKLEF